MRRPSPDGFGDNLPQLRHFLRMRKLPALALFMLALCANPAWAADSTVLQVKYAKPADMVSILKTAVLQVGAKVEITTEGTQITLHGGDEELRTKLSGILAEVDKPTGRVPTRFIKLQHASVEKAAEFLNKALAPPPEAGATAEGEDIPVQIVAATRTNEIFVMGRPADIKLVESLVRAIDTDPPPVFK